jgi:hypothetical protein
MRSSLLTGAVTMTATLAIMTATLSSGSEAWAQARRGAAPAAAGGTAQYWMSAETTSGLAAQTGMSGQSGRPSMLGALTGTGMNRGASGPGFIHNLRLELGSPRRTAAPQADHFIPAGLNAGPSLPLVSPEPAAPVTRPYQGPGGGDGGASGRILIYFGCGEHVRAGQPVEIDLARLARGQVPAMAQLAIQAMNGPNASNSATFGEWPNQRSRTTIPANGSLVGAHRIAGNYSPEINFSLAQNQDFLAPIRITQNSRAASGAVPLAWQAVPNATGYFLMAVGSRGDNTIVMWSSSEIQVQQGAFDYLSPGEAARLIAQRVVLSPSTTQCTVPAEFNQGLQGASLMMTAFGPEANFATPRPATAPRTWRPDWTVKLRTRSQYAGMLGQDIEAMMRGDRNAGRDSPQGQQPERRRRRGGLGGIVGGILGQ